MRRDPNMLTTSTNRNLFQPTRDHKTRRKTDVRESINKGKSRSTSKSEVAEDGVAAKLSHNESGSSCSNSSQSQLVDLVVEDTAAEETLRVRARKDGSTAWNLDDQKVFVRTYDPDGDLTGADIREGFEPGEVHPARPSEVTIAEDEDEDADDDDDKGDASHAPFDEERAAWNSPSRP
jgi:hypothetical protein